MILYFISLECENGHGEDKNVEKMRKRASSWGAYICECRFIYGCTDDAGVAYKGDDGR